MKMNELKTLQNNELQERLAELRKELMKERAQIAIGAALKSPGKVRSAKRTIARITTLLHQKQATVERKEVS